MQDTVVAQMLVFYMGRVKRKTSFEQAKNAKIQIILRMRKVSFDFCPPFIHSVVSNGSISGQWRPWSADVQADLGFRCPHMPKDTFSHGAAHIYQGRFQSAYMSRGIAFPAGVL